MKKILASLLATVAFTCAIAQTGVPGQISTSFVQVRDYGASGGPVTRPCMLWLPPDYDPCNSNVPPSQLLVYIHGLGDGSLYGGVNSLRNMGPFKFLYNQTWNGQGYNGSCQPNLMVFAIQSEEFTDPEELDYAITQLRLRYYTDNGIFITGASAGGESTVAYAFDVNRQNKPNMIMPMSVPFTNNSSNLSTVVGQGLKMWAFLTDPPGGTPNFNLTTNTLVNNFNSALSGSAKLTYQNLGHCCWDTFYDPTYRESDGTENLNLYEWAQKNTPYPPAQFPWLGCTPIACNDLKFAGYISTQYSDKVGACNSSCNIPFFTTTGTFSVGTYITVYGTALAAGSYGYTTTGLKGAPANKRIVINSSQQITVFDNCISLAGYVSTNSYGTPGPECSYNCSTAVYSNAGVIAQGIKLYQSDGVTPFNGGWANYGFTTTQYGTAQRTINVDGSGNILRDDACPYTGPVANLLDVAIEVAPVRNIRIFPNPTSKLINIYMPPASQQVHVQLFNMQGVMVHKSTMNGTNHKVQVNELAKGLYILKLIDNSNKLIHQQKIIIQ